MSSSKTVRKMSTLTMSKITDGISKLNTNITSTAYIPRQQQQIYPQKNSMKSTINNQTEKVSNSKVVTPTSPNKTRNIVSNNTLATSKDKRVMSITNKIVNRIPTPPNMVSCTICKRHFMPERIQLHQAICEKTSKKKRKIFDPIKQRLKGTQAECMISKVKMITKNSQATKTGNWRKQHEEFITNIKAARTVQQHLAKGGKLSDLPPPPPMDTSHYIPCPHCGRKFNEGAADRHIPKCANINNNKQKIIVSRPARVNNPTKLTTNKINVTRKR